MVEHLGDGAAVFFLESFDDRESSLNLFQTVRVMPGLLGNGGDCPRHLLGPKSGVLDLAYGLTDLGDPRGQRLQEVGRAGDLREGRDVILIERGKGLRRCSQNLFGMGEEISLRS